MKQILMPVEEFEAELARAVREGEICGSAIAFGIISALLEGREPAIPFTKDGHYDRLAKDLKDRFGVRRNKS